MTRRRTLVSVLMTSAWLAFGFSADTSSQDRATPQTVLIFIDDLHIGFANTPSLRSGLVHATERLLAAGRSIGLVSDGTSAVAIEPTNDRAPFVYVANRISGAGLKPSETTNPTPAVAVDIARRESTAQTVLQRSLAAMRPDAVIYVTDRQTEPTGVTVPLVVTKPEGMDAAVVALPSR
jgi:hypothetical protein